MTRLAFAVALTGVMHAHVASGQSLAVEVDQTVGHSTEGVSAAGTQLRTFGEVTPMIRFKVEAAWAARSADEGDAFEAAYPYAEHLQVIEAYGERLFAPGHGVLAIRVGRYRTPFGISSASDHAYNGFARAPLIRYDDYYALSNNFLEHGADVVMGTPRFSLETSIGVPGDVGEARRREGVDAVVRGQGAVGPVIVGVSYIRTRPNLPATFATGYAKFGGVDARWMRGGVQVRGEWIWGQPFDGTATAGGYVDLIVHRPSMGPLTAVARAERTAYEAPAPFAMYAQRYTAGGRIRLFDRLSAQVSLVHQTRSLSPKPLALDLGLTYSLRHDTSLRRDTVR
jgi:hypothetical protein